MTAVERRPQFQQAVYDEGYKDGRRAGFENGEKFGRSMQQLEDGFKPALGFSLGLLVAEVVVLSLHAMGVIRW